VDVYDIDLFDTPKETIDRLHKRWERRDICYILWWEALRNWRVG